MRNITTAVFVAIISIFAITANAEVKAEKREPIVIFMKNGVIHVDNIDNEDVGIIVVDEKSVIGAAPAVSAICSGKNPEKANACIVENCKKDGLKETSFCNRVKTRGNS